MMIAEINSEADIFHGLMENCFQQMNRTDSLQKLKMKAWEQYLQMGLPSKSSEVFRYLNLKRLFIGHYKIDLDSTVTEEEIKPLIYPESQDCYLVFLNGHYQPQLSNFKAFKKKAIILPVLEALKTYGTFFNNQWTKSLKEETDPFVLLNAALHTEGVFIYLPPKTLHEVPLQLINFIKTQNEPIMALPRVHLFAGSQTQLNLFSTLHVQGDAKYFVNMAADFALEEEAHISYTQNSLGIPKEQWVFDALRATLKRNSTLKTIELSEGGAGVRHDYRVALIGENAEATLNGVWMLEGKQEAHVHVLMDHQAPFCRSFQLFKGVVNGFSKSSFEGKIYVRQAAQKTEAFQLNHNIVLSDRAVALSKPNLEIFADDVKASHGATVGQLDNEQLFYMKSRGFSDQAAKNLLLYGFCKEVINLIPVPSLLNNATHWTKNYVNQG